MIGAAGAVALILLTTPPIDPPAPIAGRGYELVWHDDFEGDALDETKWSVWTLGPRKGGFNTAEAVSLTGDGHLRITVREGTDEDGTTRYETGGVWTRHTYTARYGYFEARMRLQDTHGFWSAFWLQTPHNGTPLGDPASAGVEIDVMEAIAGRHLRDQVMNTIHWDGYGEHHKKAHSKARVDNLHTAWHTFALEWTPTELVFFTDGVETWRTDAAVPRIAQYLLLTCEVGDWAGDIESADLPAEILVDYVRVWQRDI